MDQNEFNGFLIALGQEFCHAFADCQGCDEILPQDAYEVFRRAFGQDPSPQFLASLSDAQMNQWRSAFENYLECPPIPLDQIRIAVSRTLSRWPADDSH